MKTSRRSAPTAAPTEADLAVMLAEEDDADVQAAMAEAAAEADEPAPAANTPVASPQAAEAVRAAAKLGLRVAGEDHDVEVIVTVDGTSHTVVVGSHRDAYKLIVRLTTKSTMGATTLFARDEDGTPYLLSILSCTSVACHDRDTLLRFLENKRGDLVNPESFKD